MTMIPADQIDQLRAIEGVRAVMVHPRTDAGEHVLVIVGGPDAPDSMSGDAAMTRMKLVRKAPLIFGLGADVQLHIRTALEHKVLSANQPDWRPVP